MLSPEPQIKKDARQWTTVVPLTCHLIPQCTHLIPQCIPNSWLSAGLQHITESHYLPPRANEIMVLCPLLCPSSDLDSAGLRDLVALLWSPSYTSSWVHKCLIVCSGFLYLSTGSASTSSKGSLKSVTSLISFYIPTYMCIHSHTHIYIL